MPKKQAEWNKHKRWVRRHGGGKPNRSEFANRLERAIETKFRQTKRKQIEEELKAEND